MFLVKKGTQIKVFAPFGKISSKFDYAGDPFPWKPYVTKEDKLYDKEEVWDLIGAINGRDDIPQWALDNITHFGKTVVVREGKFAQVNPKDIEYLD